MKQKKAKKNKGKKQNKVTPKKVQAAPPAENPKNQTYQPFTWPSSRRHLDIDKEMRDKYSPE